MLERVLEAEIMGSLEEAEEYAAIDNRSVNEEFVARVCELGPPEGKVLDIGTGPADIAVLLARRLPGLHILAIDLGEYMLAVAQRNVASAGLESRVRVAEADAKATGLASHSFDMVISNSLVHHIPEPITVFREIMRVVSPGGAIFIKDLHRPDSAVEHRHLVETYARGCTDHQVRSFSDSLRAALTVSEVEAMCRELGLNDVTVRRSSDRHWCVERRFASQA